MKKHEHCNNNRNINLFAKKGMFRLKKITFDLYIDIQRIYRSELLKYVCKWYNNFCPVYVRVPVEKGHDDSENKMGETEPFNPP